MASFNLIADRLANFQNSRDVGLNIDAALEFQASEALRHPVASAFDVAEFPLVGHAWMAAQASATRSVTVSSSSEVILAASGKNVENVLPRPRRLLTSIRPR